MIGFIGGEIDMNSIYTNILDKNVEKAKGMGPISFYNHVDTGG